MSEQPSTAELQKLLDAASALFRAEPNILRLNFPLAVVGDIHGQFDDLLDIFRVTAPPPNQNILFLGDYVDRGYKSLECVVYLLRLKVKYPRNVYLLRGNHECRAITQVYGFFDECMRKYSRAIYAQFMLCFDALPLAAVVQNKYFAVHAGISPQIQYLSDLERVERFCEIAYAGLVSDIVWSDPGAQDEKYLPSNRGCGWLFNDQAVEEFMSNTGLQVIVRGHQMVMDGAVEQMGGRLVTIFSAPNYAFRGGNSGAIMEIDEQGAYTIQKFGQRLISTRMHDNDVEYFL